jgi:hypothetical protein
MNVTVRIYYCFEKREPYDFVGNHSAPNFDFQVTHRNCMKSMGIWNTSMCYSGGLLSHLMQTSLSQAYHDVLAADSYNHT